MDDNKRLLNKTGDANLPESLLLTVPPEELIDSSSKIRFEISVGVEFQLRGSHNQSMFFRSTQEGDAKLDYLCKQET